MLLLVKIPDFWVEWRSYSRFTYHLRHIAEYSLRAEEWRAWLFRVAYQPAYSNSMSIQFEKLFLTKLDAFFS